MLNREQELPDQGKEILIAKIQGFSEETPFFCSRDTFVAPGYFFREREATAWMTLYQAGQTLGMDLSRLKEIISEKTEMVGEQSRKNGDLKSYFAVEYYFTSFLAENNYWDEAIDRAQQLMAHNDEFESQNSTGPFSFLRFTDNNPTQLMATVAGRLVAQGEHEKGKELLEPLDFPSVEGIYYETLVTALIKKGDLENALHATQAIKGLYSEKGSAELRTAYRDSLYNLLQAYSESGQFEQAFKLTVEVEELSQRFYFLTKLAQKAAHKQNPLLENIVEQMFEAIEQHGPQEGMGNDQLVQQLLDSIRSDSASFEDQLRMKKKLDSMTPSIDQSRIEEGLFEVAVALAEAKDKTGLLGHILYGKKGKTESSFPLAQAKENSDITSLLSWVHYHTKPRQFVRHGIRSMEFAYKNGDHDIAQNIYNELLDIASPNMIQHLNVSYAQLIHEKDPERSWALLNNVSLAGLRTREAVEWLLEEAKISGLTNWEELVWRQEQVEGSYAITDEEFEKIVHADDWDEEDSEGEPENEQHTQQQKEDFEKKVKDVFVTAEDVVKAIEISQESLEETERNMKKNTNSPEQEKKEDPFFTEPTIETPELLRELCILAGETNNWKIFEEIYDDPRMTNQGKWNVLRILTLGRLG